MRWRLRSASLRSGRSAGSVTLSMGAILYPSGDCLSTSVRVGGVNGAGISRWATEMAAPGTPGAGSTPSASSDPGQRRWLILALIGLAQLMIVLDITIMNIALPSAQHALPFSNVDRQWIVTAYALSFGSLLLFGGRLGDLFGRKRVFITGLGGFAVASALGGGSPPNFAVLVSARALQGAFAALLAPATLSLLTTTFTRADERNRAFSVFG